MQEFESVWEPKVSLVTPFKDNVKDIKLDFPVEEVISPKELSKAKGNVLVCLKKVTPNIKQLNQSIKNIEKYDLSFSKHFVTFRKDILEYTKIDNDFKKFTENCKKTGFDIINT